MTVKVCFALLRSVFDLPVVRLLTPFSLDWGRGWGFVLNVPPSEAGTERWSIEVVVHAEVDGGVRNIAQQS